MDEERTLGGDEESTDGGTWRAVCPFNLSPFPEHSPEKDLVVYNVMLGMGYFGRLGTSDFIAAYTPASWLSTVLTTECKAGQRLKKCLGIPPPCNHFLLVTSQSLIIVNTEHSEASGIGTRYSGSWSWIPLI